MSSRHHVNARKIVAFDLDKTLFFCRDKHGNSIWAKQMILPIHLLDERAVVDDVGSVCELNPLVNSVLLEIKELRKPACFVSVGKYFGLDDEFQPSFEILKSFGLLNNFESSLSALEYKTFKKSQHFLKHPKWSFLLIDDNPLVREEAEQAHNCVTIDAGDQKLRSRALKWLMN